MQLKSKKVTKNIRYNTILDCLSDRAKLKIQAYLTEQ